MGCAMMGAVGVVNQDRRGGPLTSNCPFADGTGPYASPVPQENAITKVTYGPTGVEYAPCNSTLACNCDVVVNHTAINCTTTEGTGADQRWTVYIHGQQSAVPATDYARPIITGLSGAGVTNASVNGNQAVTITGNDFGPTQSKIQKVTYGPGGGEYTATSCQLTVKHSQITCMTVAGVGATLRYIVTIDGQDSSPSTATANYRAPAITALTATTSQTQGGSTVTITGTNFGAAVTNVYVELYLSGVIVPLDGGSLTRAVAGKSAYFGTNNNGQEFVIFTIPPMTDSVQKKSLRVLSASGTIAGTTQWSAPVAFTYGSPFINTIQNIQGSALLSGQTVNLIIAGRNFGTAGNGEIYFNGQPQSAFASTNNLVWGHSRISLTVVGASGSVYVTVGSQVLYFAAISAQEVLYAAPSHLM
jgi:hypothetical protein